MRPLLELAPRARRSFHLEAGHEYQELVVSVASLFLLRNLAISYANYFQCTGNACQGCIKPGMPEASQIKRVHIKADF